MIIFQEVIEYYFAESTMKKFYMIPLELRHPEMISGD